MPTAGNRAGALHMQPLEADAYGDATVDSYVYLNTGEPVVFAQQIVDMAEQTCYAHAWCRNALSVTPHTSSTANRAPSGEQSQRRRRPIPRPEGSR